eukprot:4189898-Amphidinium_carterae.1
MPIGQKVGMQLANVYDIIHSSERPSPGNQLIKQLSNPSGSGRVQGQHISPVTQFLPGAPNSRRHYHVVPGPAKPLDARVRTKTALLAAPHAQ